MGRQSLAITGTREWAVAISAALVALLAMLGPARAEAATGSISGTVVDGAAQGIPQVCVGAAGIGNGGGGSDITDANGEYTITGLGTGNFAVSFNACGNEDYVPEHYDDRPSFSSATPVAVTDGQATTGIGATLADGGSISGHVSSGLTPLGGACVEVSGPATEEAVTDGSGDYLIRNLPPGSYTVSFDGCTAGNFVSEYFDDVTEVAAATPVVVSAHVTTTGIDADLAPAGSISGTVTDTSGTPRPGVCVKARQGSTVVRSAETASDGSYSIAGLATGEYNIEFEDCTGVGVLGEFWNDKPDATSADPVHVTAPVETPSVDAVLAIDPGVDTATISGRVTNSSGSPLNGICVHAHPETESGIPGLDQTNSNGDYAITGLEADDYTIQFSSCTPPFPYITEYWNDKLNIDDANLIFVGAGETSANRNAVLANDPNVDITPPAPPTITGSSPPSPSNVNDPRIVGTAEAGSTVRVYPSSDCTGTEVTGGAAQFGSPGIQVGAVPANSETTYTATATDPSGNTSACSTSFTYTEDSNPPAAPSLTATSPASPSNEANPEVTGTAESGSTVKIYRSADCSGDVAATGGATLLGAAGITVNIPSEGTTQLTATTTDAAGNTSPCSSALAYFKDSIAPPAPDLTATDPSSPADDTTPLVRGTAEDGATIDLYTTSGCSGTPVETGTEDELSGAGIEATVANDSTTDFRATATDALGNTSPCSAARTYVEDSTPPAAPSLTSTDPVSPGNAENPKVKGNAESGSTVRLYTTSDCTGPPAATDGAGQFADPGLTVTVATNSSTDLRATATDAAGNISSCSAPLTYVHDADPPPAPSLTAVTPVSPANDNAPRVSGTAAAGTDVRVYDGCAGAPIGTGSAADFGGAGIAVDVADDDTVDLQVRAVDQAGNESVCSNAIEYVEDSTPPAAPSLTDTDPDSPANDDAPELKGTAAAGSTIKVFTGGGCGGSPAVTSTTAQLEGAGITVNVSSDTATSLRATATDAAGNESACSSPLTYVEDSTAPDAPELTSTDPNSPSNAETPNVKGSAESGSAVTLYATSDCSGPQTATGGAGQFASPGLTATVPNNSTTPFTARATDAAGNISSCSAPLTYVHDSDPPPAPSLTATSPASPSNEANPKVTGSAQPGSTVRIYRSADCSGSVVATGGATPFGTTGIAVNIPSEGTTQLTARATDTAGNASPCSSPLAYLRVAPPPPPPPPPPPGDDPPSNPPPSDPPPLPAAQCIVPNLKSMSTSAAETALEAAKCALGEVTKKKVKKGKSGKVLSQSPAAGQSLPVGTQVSVTVSKVKKKKKKKKK